MNTTKTLNALNDTRTVTPNKYVWGEFTPDVAGVGYKELPVQTEVADTSTATLAIDVGGPSLVSISVDTLRKLVGTDIVETLQLVTWVDALPETGESKYIYAVPREETDTEGKQIAALYLWDGSAWRGAAAFSLNIDPDTLATKTELAGYLPLSGGTLSDNLVVRKGNPEITIKSHGYQSTLKLDNSERYDGSSSAIYNIACLEKQLYIYRSDRGAANSILIDAGGNLAKRTPSGNFLFLSTESKGIANGIASLDANGKVPTQQIPVATASALGGVKLEFDETTGTLNIKTE